MSCCCVSPTMFPYATGVPPTDKPVELLVVVVMKFENGKIVHEHIYWDQGLAVHEYMKIASSHGNAMNVFL